MDKRIKYAILTIALVQIFVIIGLMVLPVIAQALPGEYRVRLARLPVGERLLDIGVTPLPTALPAPSGAVAQSQIIIPTIIVRGLRYNRKFIIAIMFSIYPPWQAF